MVADPSPYYLCGHFAAIPYMVILSKYNTCIEFSMCNCYALVYITIVGHPHELSMRWSSTTDTASPVAYKTAACEKTSVM